MLLHIHGNINIKVTLLSNIIPATPSKGMQAVLNQRSLSQSICRSCVNDIRVGQISRLHQYPIDSDIDLGHVKDPHIPYASGEFCYWKGYQSQNRGQFSGTVCFCSSEEYSSCWTRAIKQGQRYIWECHGLCRLSYDQWKDCNCLHLYYALHGGLLQSLHKHEHNYHRYHSNDEPQSILHQILLNFVAIVM